MARNLSPEQREHLNQLITERNDLSNMEIARRVGCDDNTVRRYRILAGLPAPAVGPTVDVEMIADLARRGKTTATIAQIVGCSTRTVARHRKALGVATPPQRTMTAGEIATARKLVESGASLNQIADAVGFASTSVRRHFPDYPGWTAAEGCIYRHARDKLAAAGYRV